MKAAFALGCKIIITQYIDWFRLKTDGVRQIGKNVIKLEQTETIKSPNFGREKEGSIINSIH